MKIITNSFPIRVLLLVFFALLATAQLAPLANNIIIPNQADLYNHIATIISAAQEITRQFPLRVANLRGDGWLYPYYQFYVPTSYMYAGFIYKYLTPANPYIAYKLTIWSALIFGGIYLYRLVYWFTKSYPAALLAAVVLLTAPYLNILVGALGAFNEIIAICLIPFILFYTLRDYENPNNLKYLLLVSLGWYLLITTHVITFIYAAALIGILLFLLTLQTKQWINLCRAGVAIFFSAAMASWFLIPEIMFSHYFAVSSSFPTADFIYESSANLPSMFSPMLSKILNMQQNVITRAHVAIGLPIIIGVGVAVYAIFINSVVKKNYRFDYFIVPLLIIFFIAFFLLWSPVNIWHWLPKSLLVIQYTMRMLAQLIWIGALIFAWAIYWLFDGALDRRHAAVGILLIFAATSSLLPTLASGPYGIKELLKKPVISFNPDSYVIDPWVSSSLIDQVDNYILDTLYDNRKLKLNALFNMPRSLLSLAKNPEIVFDGYILNKNNKNRYALELIVDDQIVGTLPLQKTGPITWKIPLVLSALQSKKNILPIQFKLKNVNTKSYKNTSDITIQADKIQLIGFLTPAETINVNQLASSCKNLNNEMTCHLSVPRGVSLLELPMLYYPSLLKITLNNKVVPYHGVLFNGKILVGITPIAGVQNTIKGEFIGLPSANIASWISWSLWGVIFLGWIRRVFQCRNSHKDNILS